MINNDSDPIPGDDILDVYIAMDRDVRRAVSNIMTSGGNMISLSFGGTTPSGEAMVHVDWKANQEMSLLMVSLGIKVGTMRFGDTWLQQLLQNLQK